MNEEELDEEEKELMNKDYVEIDLNSTSSSTNSNRRRQKKKIVLLERWRLSL
eukprot:jgi/Orpsp1_1/1186229/evm.model.d7180000049067.1